MRVHMPVQLEWDGRVVEQGARAGSAAGYCPEGQTRRARCTHVSMGVLAGSGGACHAPRKPTRELPGPAAGCSAKPEGGRPRCPPPPPAPGGRSTALAGSPQTPAMRRASPRHLAAPERARWQAPGGFGTHMSPLARWCAGIHTHRQSLLYHYYIDTSKRGVFW